MQQQADNGPVLLLLATLLSFQIAAGRSTEELAVLSALFSVIGDNLALLTATRPNLVDAVEQKTTSPQDASAQGEESTASQQDCTQPQDA